MLSPKMSGIFDCRKYDQSGKLTHDQRQLLADTDNIAFSAIFPINQVPDEFTNNGVWDSMLKSKSSRKEREAAKAEGRNPVADVVVAKFKIGANTRWFNKFGKPCERPTNAELEESRWNVQIDFTKREKNDADPLKPSGYWVNCIMVAKVEQNPFAGQAFETEAEPEPEPESTQEPISDEEADDLPFGN